MTKRFHLACGSYHGSYQRVIIYLNKAREIIFSHREATPPPGRRGRRFGG